MKFKNVLILRTLFLITSLLIFLAWFIFGFIHAINYDPSTGTSFPWYTGFAVAGIVLVLPFIISLVFFLYFRNSSKKSINNNLE